jgi:hypothetical protein
VNEIDPVPEINLVYFSDEFITAVSAASPLPTLM